jgi:hypothetical protein
MYIDALTIAGTATFIGLVAWIAALYHRDPGHICPESATNH